MHPSAHPSFEPKSPPASPARPLGLDASSGLRPPLRHSEHVWLATCVIVAAATLPFVSTLQGYFIGDDFGLVHLFSQKPLFHFLTLFTAPWTETIYGLTADELRPILMLSYKLDGLWGAASPVPYHVTNILLHVVNVLLVFALARRAAGLSPVTAMFSASLFAVLPVHAETVSWISGRADSQPAAVYLAVLLAYVLWRRSRRWWLYVTGVVLFFFALFSKQSAITMVATLAAYDLLVERRSFRRPLPLLACYLPFIFLTIGYLLLRMSLFGNAVREGQIEADSLIRFALLQPTYLRMAFTGIESVVSDPTLAMLTLAGLGTGIVLVVVQVVELTPDSSQRARLFLTFGPAWWIITVAPLVVTYVSARHLYLPSVGLAIVFGIGCDSLLTHTSRNWRRLTAVGATVLVVAYTVALLPRVQEWNNAAALSGTIARDVRREALSASDGTLLVIGAPAVGVNNRVFTWVWAFALPFALQEPFTEQDLTRRLFFMPRSLVDCCGASLWFTQTREQVTRWSQRSAEPAAILLRWDPHTGVLTKRTTSDDTILRQRLQSIGRTESPLAMSRELDSLLDAFK